MYNIKLFACHKCMSCIVCDCYNYIMKVRLIHLPTHIHKYVVVKYIT